MTRDRAASIDPFADGRGVARAPAREEGDTADDAGAPPWLTASAIARATYCPYQLYLAESGAARDADSRRALRRGNDVHAAWNERQRRATRPSPARVALRAVLSIALVATIALLLALGLRAVGAS